MEAQFKHTENHEHAVQSSCFFHDRVERPRGEFSDGEDEREEWRNEIARAGRAVIWGLFASCIGIQDTLPLAWIRPRRFL